MNPTTVSLCRRDFKYTTNRRIVQMLSEFKEKLLNLLEKDREFRYAVAGLIGLDEILKRLDKHDEKFNEILTVLKEHTARLEEHDRKFNGILSRLDEHDRKFNQVIARLEEHDKKFNEILERLDRHENFLKSYGRELIRLRRHVDALGVHG